MAYLVSANVRKPTYSVELRAVVRQKEIGNGVHRAFKRAGVPGLS
jgi:hypothetical protein